MNTSTVSTTLRTTKRRLGGWLPNNEDALVAFRTRLAAHVKTQQQANVQLFPVVQDLATLINDDPVLRMGFTQAINQALKAGVNLGYTSIDELIGLINGIMTYAPPFSTSELVGCPLNALLDWPMCMPAGFALFRSAALNAQLKQVLNFWCSFLSGPDSRNYLNETSPTGWFCSEAIQYTNMSQFQCDPSQPYWGFSSWNDFFTREFKPGERPVADPTNNKVIVSACEATPYNIQQNVKLQDTFWIKSQPYSLQDIFTASQLELAQLFVGGSVYQAFLSAYNYHRWHAPISGTITDAYLVNGTYYSDAESEGLDPAGPNDSQGYITAVAARAVVVIECDDASVGKVACVFVGMAEISSCVLEVKLGQHVAKGDEVGYFQYGGSTHCLIFQPGVIQSFIPKPPFNFDAPPIKINSQIATAN
ncbi:MAG: phosphatidylserine decarboxylase family protein [Acidobacteriota bacterium]